MERERGRRERGERHEGAMVRLKAYQVTPSESNPLGVFNASLGVDGWNKHQLDTGKQKINEQV